MDLVGLTQSVAMVTGENINSVEPAQPLSPNQGRVAVVIRPPLTPGNLRYIAEKTEFFKVSSKNYNMTKTTLNLICLAEISKMIVRLN